MPYYTLNVKDELIISGYSEKEERDAKRHTTLQEEAEK
jgi:hypothetical protein